MKLLTYNILNGGQPDRLPLIREVVHSLDADIVCLQETNGFDALEGAILKSFGHSMGYHCHAFAPCGTLGKNYSVATYAKSPIISSEAIPGLRHAGQVVLLKGGLAVCNVLISHVSEDERLRELRLVANFLAPYENKIICGDFNMLSPWDKYDPSLLDTFNEKQRSRFAAGGKLEFRAALYMAEQHYRDAAQIAGAKGEWTVRTKGSASEGHPLQARLDYVFVCNSLAPKVRSMEVIRAGLTDKASDHYPVLVDFD